MGQDGFARGRVKWFDTRKGYGFLVAEDSGTDILLHVNVLRAFGQTSVAAGALVDVEVEQTARGTQATRILNIEVPAREVTPQQMAQLLGLGALMQIDHRYYPARVKWFDRAKGFGFVNLFGQEGDVFIHIEVLHACGLSMLEVGEAVCVRTATGPRGRLSWEVRSWDHARQLVAERGGDAPAGLSLPASDDGGGRHGDDPGTAQTEDGRIGSPALVQEP